MNELAEAADEKKRERRAIAVASNAPLSEWKQTFTDRRLCAAVVDRLTFGGNLIQTGTDSHRLAVAQAEPRHKTPLADLTRSAGGDAVLPRTRGSGRPAAIAVRWL